VFENVCSASARTNKRKELAKGVTILNGNEYIEYQEKDGFASCKEIEENNTE
jgi:hypothetical protein